MLLQFDGQRLDTLTAIADYKQIVPKIFREGLFGHVGKVAKGVLSKPWFKSEALEQAIKSIVRERLPLEEKSLQGFDLETQH